MQNFIEIQQCVFDDAKKIIIDLSACNSEHDLINKQQLIVQLQEYIHFLKISKQFGDIQTQDIPFQIIEGQQEEYDSSNKLRDKINDKYLAEEEVIFNNELNEIHESEIDHPEINLEQLEEEAVFNNQLNEIDNNHPQKEQETEIEDFIINNTLQSSENVDLKLDEGFEYKKKEQEQNVQEDKQSDDYDVNRGKIQEIVHESKNVQNEEEVKILQEQADEKKFKLANIKGLKKLQELFDDDPLENIPKNQDVHTENVGSLLKSNIPKDFMEAEKTKPEFKLDLNDRIAFSKALFEGNEDEMNTTINRLNNCKTLEEAKEFLSDLYYERNWKKADEYAQRLWSLVENKFL